jgi:preprotein translocase subunit YajC
VHYLTLVIPLLIIIALFAFTARARRRQASSDAQRTERIAVGTAVMTTSGMHGTVAAKNDDGTVQLSIAPGVEVRWEMAALRDVASLPNRYRRGPGVGPAGALGDRPGSDGPVNDGPGNGSARDGEDGASGTSGVQLRKED